MGNLHIILDAQFGDTGKGKIIDFLGIKKNFCFRFQGGSNAGHTIVVNGQKFFTHLLPSAILNSSCTCVLGNGMVINLNDLMYEIDTFERLGINCENRVKISENAHVVLHLHKLIDSKNNKHLGTTCKGIGPCYADKMQRIGLRIRDVLSPDSEIKSMIRKVYNSHNVIDEPLFQKDVYDVIRFRDYLEKMVVDLKFIKNVFSDTTNNILIEGANGLMLDIDHGTYPFVTSSNCSIGGVFTGLGINPTDLKHHHTEIVGIVKSYVTRVGTGPFPTEQANDIGRFLLTTGQEYGVTTGRNRRCGWLDLVQLKYSCDVNGYDILNLTKLDILGQLDDIYLCTGYTPTDNKPILLRFDSWKTLYDKRPYNMNDCTTWESLHPNAKKYIQFIESFLGVPVKYINTGKERHQLLIKN